MHLFNALKIRH